MALVARADYRNTSCTPSGASAVGCLWTARLRIDRTTLTPIWDGDRLDPEPILDALLPRRVKTAA